MLNKIYILLERHNYFSTEEKLVSSALFILFYTLFKLEVLNKMYHVCYSLFSMLHTSRWVDVCTASQKVILLLRFRYLKWLTFPVFWRNGVRLWCERSSQS